MEKLTITIIKGYAGSQKVTAHIYPGKDHGLSFYILEDGRTLVGTVEFTHILKKYTTEYPKS